MQERKKRENINKERVEEYQDVRLLRPTGNRNKIKNMDIVYLRTWDFQNIIL